MADSGSQTTKKGFWHNPTVVALAPILVSWLLTKIENVKLEWAWTWIPEWVVSIGRWFNTPIGLKPAWIISAAAAAYLLVRLINSASARLSTDGPDMSFLSYVADRIDGLEWKWKWRRNSEGKFDMENILALCPKCSYPMIWTTTNLSFGFSKDGLRCEECDFSHDLGRSMYSAQDRIRRRVFHTVEQKAQEASKKNG
ncbi:hypothetical protein [Cupriavidus taiwanensis]|uniref:Uncharacterized protein n=1 Tax=Cupriavidus taiwanensis (strain DSM 17343 / BCRC 17206 / CCUG 44338 / CIP 107171 / LMG 19424 / R1) TaxID=977880 RepID=B3R9I4_CUPTR|nr:hypothetical protein [Cupriavidus taiwanensis]CAQ71559.1 hypothetical protein RALTA_B0947 [Cupriavidus taiwanensis LMG 19424]